MRQVIIMTDSTEDHDIQGLIARTPFAKKTRSERIVA